MFCTTLLQNVESVARVWIGVWTSTINLENLFQNIPRSFALISAFIVMNNKRTFRTHKVAHVISTNIHPHTSLVDYLDLDTLPPWQLAEYSTQKGFVDTEAKIGYPARNSP